MSHGYGGHCGFTCELQCPQHTMCIQPPRFYVTIPGPNMNCYNEPMVVDCNAPCAYGCGSSCGGYGGGYRGGYGGDYGAYGGYGSGHGYGCGVRCGTGHGIRG